MERVIQQLNSKQAIFKKQVIIRYLLSSKHCFDLYGLIEEYLFVDKRYVEIRNKRLRLIKSLKLLSHSTTEKDSCNDRGEVFYWLITWGFSLAFSGSQCTFCGEYKMSGEPSFHHLLPGHPPVARRAVCSCSGENEAVPQHNVVEQPLQIYY